MTRFEQIKAMDIEELAKELDKFEGLTDEICHAMHDCPYMDEDGDISDDCDCVACIIKWLESEVEGNET